MRLLVCWIYISNCFFTIFKWIWISSFIRVPSLMGSSVLLTYIYCVLYTGKWIDKRSTNLYRRRKSPTLLVIVDKEFQTMALVEGTFVGHRVHQDESLRPSDMTFQIRVFTFLGGLWFLDYWHKSLKWLALSWAGIYNHWTCYLCLDVLSHMFCI